VFVCILPGKAVSEMTYTVSGGTLNLGYTLIHQPLLLATTAVNIVSQVC